MADDRIMPTYFLMNDIKRHISEGNDLSVFILSLISMQNKNWTELHPEHLHLILDAMNLYDNGSLKKQIIIEIIYGILWYKHNLHAEIDKMCSIYKADKIAKMLINIIIG